MPKGASSTCFFVFFLPLVLFLCNSVNSTDIPHAKDAHDFEKRELEREKEQLFPSIHRFLMDYFRYKMTEFDSIDPPTTTVPTAPITNPVAAPAVTVPPGNSAPGIVTVPGTNPGGVSSLNPTTTSPGTNPVNPPVPVTNPVTTPSTNPGGQPSVNPVIAPSPPSGGSVNPVMPPSTTSGGNAPAGRGQSWCIAKNGASESALQSALDYACGIGGADCSTIQQGASCYNPATLQNHASYAFNSYYQKNPAPTSCDFGGAAVVTSVNPSTGSCVYPSSSSSSTTPTTPTTQAPTNPTSLPPPTSFSSGSTVPGAQSPPPVFSLGNPNTGTGLGGFGASPPLMDTTSVSNILQPFIGSLLIVTSITVGRLIFGL